MRAVMPSSVSDSVEQEFGGHDFISYDRHTSHSSDLKPYRKKDVRCVIPGINRNLPFGTAPFSLD